MNEGVDNRGEIASIFLRVHFHMEDGKVNGIRRDYVYMPGSIYLTSKSENYRGI